jgi:hypothetical protein
MEQAGMLNDFRRAVMKTASLGLLEVIRYGVCRGGIPPGPPPLYCVDPAVFESIGGIVGRIWEEDSTTTTDGLLIFKPYRPSAYSSLVNVEFSMPGEEGIKLLKTKRR